MADIVLGKEFFETVRIKDASGKVLSEFSFNPSDTGIVARYDDFTKALPVIAEKIEAYESANSNKNSFERAKELLQEIDSLVYEQFNRFLDGDVAESIFSVMGPLSPTPYGYYMTFILEQILEAINKSTNAKLKKMDAKISKHTAKYRGK